MSITYNRYFVCHLKNGITLDFDKRCKRVEPMNDTDKMIKFLTTVERNVNAITLAIIPSENILYINMIEE